MKNKKENLIQAFSTTWEEASSKTKKTKKLKYTYMKKEILALLTVMLVSIGSLVAQDGPSQRQTAEERTKATMEKLAALSLATEAKTKAEDVFLDFYKAQQKAMEDMRASGSMDREGIRAKRDELAKVRDEQLKAILTADQLKKWSEEIEPSLRPQRRN